MTTINPISNVKSEQNLRTVINQVVRQVSDVSGNISVSANGDFVFKNTRLYNLSVILFSPRNTSAMNSKWYVDTISKGEAVIRFTGITTPASFDYFISGVE